MRSKYVEGEDLSRLKETLSEDEWLPLWVSLETGLRIGDVVKLRRENVQKDGLHYKAQKTKKNGVAKIGAHLRKRLEGIKGKWLFPSPYKPGAHLTRQCAWARIKRACARAGVDPAGISPHSLRKVFAVELYRESGFKAVQSALQHSSAATTEIYSYADWSTGENAERPLMRKDLTLIIKMVIEALGDGYEPKRGSREKEKGG